jgi:hypothetical protein
MEGGIVYTKPHEASSQGKNYFITLLLDSDRNRFHTWTFWGKLLQMFERS